MALAFPLQSVPYPVYVSFSPSTQLSHIFPASSLLQKHFMFYVQCQAEVILSPCSSRRSLRSMLRYVLRCWLYVIFVCIQTQTNWNWKYRGKVEIMWWKIFHFYQSIKKFILCLRNGKKISWSLIKEIIVNHFCWCLRKNQMFFCVKMVKCMEYWERCGWDRKAKRKQMKNKYYRLVNPHFVSMVQDQGYVPSYAWRRKVPYCTVQQTFTWANLSCATVPT